MQNKLVFFRIAFVCIILCFLNAECSKSRISDNNTLTIFAGSASKPATEEIIKIFKEKTGIRVNVTYGGSGYVLSQMILAKTGDIYFPGSSDYMEKAKKGGYVYPETENVVVYLVPSINVQKGNPKNIQGLKDLLRPGLRVAIANPEGVCVGVYAVEIIEKNFTPEEKRRFKKNLVNYTGSCSKTMMAISLKAADAVLGWSVFQFWDPKTVETIPLRKNEIARVGYLPVAVSTFTKNRSLAERFIDFVLSDEAQSIFRKHHYIVSPEKTFTLAGEKPVGGVYEMPEGWIKK